MELRDYVPTRVLHDFVGRIERLGIRYMLTGSMAMIRYTVFRQTADIDVVLEFSDFDAASFITALEPDYYVPHDLARRVAESGRMFNVIHVDTAFKIDCMINLSADFQKAAFENREETDYYGRKIWIIRREDLILSKLWWARDSRSDMQLRDVKNLMRSGFDVEYVAKCAERLGFASLYFECRDEAQK